MRQGRHKRPKARQGRRANKDNNNHKREEQKSLKTKQTRTQGDVADAEMQSTGVPSTWRGTGQYSKEQRLGLPMYGSHFSPQTMHHEDAYSLAVLLQSAWPDTHSRTAPRGYTGWHDPCSSLSSPRESKYHIHKHRTRSPTLVGMPTGSGA